MRLYKALWLVITNWGDPEFCGGFGKFIKKWKEILAEREQALKAKKIVPPHEPTSSPETRRSKTNVFYFTVLQEGEKRNLERKGTAFLTSDQIKQDLEVSKKNPDGSWKPPK